jgi:hypothetical protein
MQSNATRSGILTNTPTKSQRTVARIRRFTEDRGIERDGWCVGEWCAKKGLSPNGFYRLPQVDRPLTIKVGNKQIITKNADQEWESMMLDRARARRESGAA